MSTTQPSSSARAWEPPDSGYYPDTSRDGWILFCGSILLLVATMNLIYGIAAVSNSKFFVGSAEYVLSDLNTWGWVLIVLAAGQLATGFGVFFEWTGVRWVGAAFASLNAIAQLLVMPAYPFWSLLLFALDIFVIYGLVVHAGKAAA